MKVFLIFIYFYNKIIFVFSKASVKSNELKDNVAKKSDIEVNNNIAKNEENLNKQEKENKNKKERTNKNKKISKQKLIELDEKIGNFPKRNSYNNY